MTIKIIEKRLKEYPSRTKQDEKNALREIAQEIALSALARTDFFKQAAFIGGSCLRIVHSLQRFSEDLDFWTLETDPNFHWKPYLQAVSDEFKAYGFSMITEDREKAEAKIQRAFLKNDSIGKVLTLTHAGSYMASEKLQIKLEIDTRPPGKATFEPRNIDFPYPFAITALDKPSLFASKIAALFDLKSQKGRHWYDFIWYISNKWPINYLLLGNALPDHPQEVSFSWLQQALRDLIPTIKWEELRDDVRNFISQGEQETLELWNKQFFLGYLEKLGEQLQPASLSLAALIADKKGPKLKELVEKALSSGAPVDDDSRNGHRPLQIALREGLHDIAKILIERGADPNYRDRSGLTPLQTAVNHGQFESARLLLKSGAHFNPQEPNLAFDYPKLYQFIHFWKE